MVEISKIGWLGFELFIFKVWVFNIFQDVLELVVKVIGYYVWFFQFEVWVVGVNVLFIGLDYGLIVVLCYFNNWVVMVYGGLDEI